MAVRRRKRIAASWLELGTPERQKAIVRLVASASTGEIVIVHQDGCLLVGELKPRCSCVPSMWRVERGSA